MHTFENINDFLYAAANSIKNEFPGHNVEPHTATKNNNVKLHGIMISKQDSAVAPTVYVDHYFDALKAGCPFGSILEEIKQECKEVLESTLMDMNTDFIKDFAALKDNICFKLVNKELNKNRLVSMPHRDFHGLAIMFYIQLKTTDTGTSTIDVTDTLAQIWGVDEAQLYALAQANTKRLHRGCIIPLSDVIAGMMDVHASHEYESFDFTKCENNCLIPMYVATNPTNKNGAAVILYPGLLEDVSKELGSFIVIPSSINEVILVPDTFCNKMSDLSSMVRDINATDVLEFEILSDQCLFYDAGKHTLEEIA